MSFLLIGLIKAERHNVLDTLVEELEAKDQVRPHPTPRTCDSLELSRCEIQT